MKLMMRCLGVMFRVGCSELIGSNFLQQSVLCCITCLCNILHVCAHVMQALLEEENKELREANCSAAEFLLGKSLSARNSRRECQRIQRLERSHVATATPHLSQELD